MKDLIRRWLGIDKPSAKKTTREFEDLAAAAIEALGKAQQAHISDLRVLIDKGHEREAELAGMVKLAVEHQFYRPSVSGGPRENKINPAILPEQMTDVAVFDEAIDQAQVKEQEDALAKLIEEQNQQGMHKVEA